MPQESKNMEVMIELTAVELELVTGGLVGAAGFSFTNTASGTIAVVASTFDQVTTESFAGQAGTFVSVSSST
jgi:hypothetical protein